MKKLLTTRWQALLILAIALRILVAGFLFHPDIKTYNFQSSFLKRGVFNIYSFLVENKKTLPFKEEFVYFPLTYFAVGGYQWIASPILGSSFNSWLANANSNSFVRDPNIFKYLLVLKLPYLILDILIAFLLKKFFDEKEKGEKAFTLWLFNPFTIVLIYAFSNIDIYAVLLTLVAFLIITAKADMSSSDVIKKEKLLQATAVLGLAAGFKLYPILFIPFLILKAKDLKEKILVGVIPALILGVVISPFWSQDFVHSALISGLTTGIFNTSFATLASGLFFYEWLIDKRQKPLYYWIILLLSIFSFSHFHIAWLLWVAPFIVILVVKKPVLSLPLFLLATFAFVIPTLYEDRSMTISLFRVYSTWYDLLPTPFSVLEKFYDPYNLRNILHSVVAGGSLLIAYKILRKDKTS